MLRDSIDVYTDVLDICSRAQLKGITPGILSNHASCWLMYVVNKHHLEKTFDNEMIAVSQEIGYDKPSKEVYDALYEKIVRHMGSGMAKSQIVFVDDKLPNVVAANEFGFRGIHFDHLEQEGKVLEKKLNEIGVHLS